VAATLSCSAGYIIGSLVNPFWGCPPSANSSQTYSLLAAACLGKTSCTVTPSWSTWGDREQAWAVLLVLLRPSGLELLNCKD